MVKAMGRRVRKRHRLLKNHLPKEKPLETGAMGKSLTKVLLRTER